MHGSLRALTLRLLQVRAEIRVHLRQSRRLSEQVRIMAVLRDTAKIRLLVEL